MSEVRAEVWQGAGGEREVQVTTDGRKTGKPRRVTIWIGTDGKRLYIRSGQGMRRHWPQNLLAKGEGLVRLGKADVKGEPRLVNHPTRTPAVFGRYSSEYSSFRRPSPPGHTTPPASPA